MPDIPVEPTPAGQYPGDMEARIAVLEQIAANTAATLGRIERQVETLTRQVEGLDRRMDGFDHRMAMFDQRMEAFDRRMDMFDRRMDAFERRMDMLDARRHSDFKWVLSVMFAGFTATFAGFGTMLGVMAHGFHWL